MRWSQVLVFTRTKFGANNVAEFLTKNGVNAMALHGGKSPTPAPRRLSAGHKGGDIRALVATDIAARGIVIDELPRRQLRNLAVSEDYVHRIGNAGRAGNSGEAVSLVCMDGKVS